MFPKLSISFPLSFVRLLGGNTMLAFFGKNGDRVRNNDLLDPVMLKISAR